MIPATTKNYKLEPERLEGLNSEAAEKIMFDAPTNPSLEVLEEINDESLRVLDKHVICRTCPSSIWARKRRELICYCPELLAVTWKSSKPGECEIFVCSARTKPDETEQEPQQ